MWNPIEEHIEGKLCENGFMTEVFDFKKNDLSRSLTPLGKQTAKNLLKEPKWRKIYLYMARKQTSHLPLEARKKIWKKIANQLRDINVRKE